MWKKIVKWLAGIVLDYLPDAVVWVVEMATGKVAENGKAQRVLDVINIIAEDAAKLSKAMSDGKINDTEKAAISARAAAVADEIKALL